MCLTQPRPIRNIASRGLMPERNLSLWDHWAQWSRKVNVNNTTHVFKGRQRVCVAMRKDIRTVFFFKDTLRISSIDLWCTSTYHWYKIRPVCFYSTSLKQEMSWMCLCIWCIFRYNFLILARNISDENIGWWTCIFCYSLASEGNNGNENNPSKSSPNMSNWNRQWSSIYLERLRAGHQAWSLFMSVSISRMMGLSERKRERGSMVS